MSCFTIEEFKTRITALQKILIEKNIDVAVFNHPVELYYYSGSVIPLYCIIPAKGESFLLARKGSSRIKEETQHMPLEIFSSTKDLLTIINKRSLNDIKKCGFVFESSTYSAVVRMLSLFGNPEPADITQVTRMLRCVKSDAEILIQRRAGEIISAIPEIIRTSYKDGITELQMSAHIEFYLRTNGAGNLKCRQEGLVLSPGVFSTGVNSLSSNKFDGICSGRGLSASLPFGGSDKIIPHNTPIICDYGLVYEGYHVDMTRMFSIEEPSDEVLKAYNAMLMIENEVIESLCPGVSWESIWQIAENSATKLGYEKQFMGLGTEKVKFVGHGLGLFLDEPPFLAPKMSDVIKEKMVIAVEPKVALPDIGIVGIENSFVVTAEGAECITNCPRDFYIL